MNRLKGKQYDLKIQEKHEKITFTILQKLIAELKGNQKPIANNICF